MKIPPSAPPQAGGSRSGSLPASGEGRGGVAPPDNTALVLTVDFPPEAGGIQRYTYAVCRHLRHLRPLVLAPDSPGAGAFDLAQPFPTWRLRAPVRRRSAVVLPMALAAFAIALRRPPHVTLCAHVVVTPIAMALSRARRVPFVLFVHGMELRTSRTRRLGHAALRSADLVVANSRFTAAEAIRLGARPERLYTTALGVSPEWIAGTADTQLRQAMLRQRLGLNGDRVILSVSRLVDRYKGHDAILQAIPLVAAKVPNVRYVVAGDGPRRPLIETLARRLGVADRVTFAGHLSDDELRTLYGLADVFVLANQETLAGGGAEGFGIVFAEAAACGLPVVGGRSGGVADAVFDGRTGLLVDPTDPADIAETLVRLLGDRALAARLGEAGRKRVAAELTWPAIVEGIETRILQIGVGGAHSSV